MPNEIIKIVSKKNCTVQEIQQAFEKEKDLSKTDGLHYTVLIHAVKNSNFNIIEWLFLTNRKLSDNQRFDINQRSKEGKTALVYAIEDPLFNEKDNKIVSKLLIYHASLDKKKDQAALEKLKKNPMLYTMFQIQDISTQSLEQFEKMLMQIIRDNPQGIAESLGRMRSTICVLNEYLFKQLIFKKDERRLTSATQIFKSFNEKWAEFLLIQAIDLLYTEDFYYYYPHIIFNISVACFSEDNKLREKARDLLVCFKNRFIINNYRTTYASTSFFSNTKEYYFPWLNFLEFRASPFFEEKPKISLLAQENKPGDLARIANKNNCSVNEFKAVFLQEQHLNIADNSGCTSLMNSVIQKNVPLVLHLLFDDDYPNHMVKVNARNSNGNKTALIYLLELTPSEDMAVILYSLLIKGAEFDKKMDSDSFRLLQQNNLYRAIYDLATEAKSYPLSLTFQTTFIKNMENILENSNLEGEAYNWFIKACWRSIIGLIEIYLIKCIEEKKPDDSFKKIDTYINFLKKPPRLLELILERAQKELQKILLQPKPNEHTCRFLISCFAIPFFTDFPEKTLLAKQAFRSLQHHLTANAIHEQSRQIIHFILTKTITPLVESKNDDDIFSTTNEIEKEIDNYENSYFGGDNQLQSLYSLVKSKENDPLQIKSIWKSITRLGEIHLRKYNESMNIDHLNQAKFYFNLLNPSLGLSDFFLRRAMKILNNFSSQFSYPEKKDLKHLIGLFSILCFNDERTPFQRDYFKSLEEYIAIGRFFNLKETIDFNFYVVSVKMLVFLSTYHDHSLLRVENKEEKKPAPSAPLYENEKQLVPSAPPQVENNEEQTIPSAPLPEPGFCEPRPASPPLQLVSSQTSSSSSYSSSNSFYLFSPESKENKQLPAFQPGEFISFMLQQTEGENDTNKVQDYLQNELKKFYNNVCSNLKSQNLHSKMSEQIKNELDKGINKFMLNKTPGIRRYSGT